MGSDTYWQPAPAYHGGARSLDAGQVDRQRDERAGDADLQESRAREQRAAHHAVVPHVPVHPLVQHRLQRPLLPLGRDGPREADDGAVRRVDDPVPLAVQQPQRAPRPRRQGPGTRARLTSYTKDPSRDTVSGVRGQGRHGWLLSQSISHA
jgi:hypothetical protein